MASLAITGVTFLDSWKEKNIGGRETLVRRVSLVLSTMGSVANSIPVSLFDMVLLHSASTFVQSDNSITVVAGPSADGTLLLLKNAGSNAPADYTGTFIGTVRGQ